jgi:hypothetical protein
MSLWEFIAATGGVAKANAPPDQQGLNTAEAKAIAERLDQAPEVWH